MEEGSEEDQVLTAHSLMWLVDEQVREGVWKLAPFDQAAVGHHHRVLSMMA